MTNNAKYLLTGNIDFNKDLQPQLQTPLLPKHVQHQMASGFLNQTTQMHNIGQTDYNEDMMSVSTYNSSKFQKFNPKDPLEVKKANDTFDQDQERYKSDTFSQKQGLDNASKELKKKMDIFKERIVSYLDHSSQIFAIHSEPIIPDFVTNLNEKTFWISLKDDSNKTNLSFPAFSFVENDIIPFASSVTIKDTKSTSSKKKETEEIKQNGNNVFGSTNAYVQGIDIPIRPFPSGDLQNAFIIEIKISDIVNEYPYCVGVTFEYLIGNDQDKKNRKYTSLGNKSYYSPQTNKNYHFIIPPKHNNIRIHPIYWSNHTINNEDAKQYTWLTGNAKGLYRKTMPYLKTQISLPVMHPVSKRFFEIRSAYPKWGIGEHTHLGTKRYIMDRSIFAFIADQIAQEIRENVPIVDLSSLRMTFDILNPSIGNKLFYQAMKSEDNNLHIHQFYFSIQMKWCFRSSIYDQEEREEDDDDDEQIEIDEHEDD